MSGYVVDHFAFTAGLADSGNERQRSELSRMLVGALEGGPALAVPALCLAVSSGVRPAIVAHFAEIVAGSPEGAITITAFERTAALDAVRRSFPKPSWACAHAVVTALALETPLLTSTVGEYAGVPIDILEL